MPVRVISSINSKKLALKIANHIGAGFVQYEIIQFRIGEYIVKIYENLLHYEKIYIVANIVRNDDIMEVLSIIDACKHAGASNITLIAPYIAYGRQNKMELPYSSIGFEILANIINNSNIDRLITVDIHEYSLLSLFNFEVTHITSSDIIKYYSQELGLEEYIMVALDLGSKKRLGSTASVYLHKKRSDNLISMELNGKVIGEKCLLIDDIIDSGRSMEAAIKCLNHHGAIDLRPYVTHFLCDKPFMIELYASDSIESNHASHRILSIVPLICRLL